MKHIAVPYRSENSIRSSRCGWYCWSSHSLLILCSLTGIWHRPSSQQAEIWPQIVSKYTMLLKWSCWVYFWHCDFKSIVFLIANLARPYLYVIWCMVLFGFIVLNPVHCKRPANVSCKWNYILNKHLNGNQWKYLKSTHFVVFRKVCKDITLNQIFWIFQLCFFL